MCVRISDGELLHRDPLVESMFRIEEEAQRLAAVNSNFNRGDIADFQLIGDCRNRALHRIEHPEHDLQVVRHQRTAPAAWTEGADRRQRNQVGAEWQDGSLRRKVVCRRTRRRRHQHAIADELRKHGSPVDRHLDPCRLARFAQQRDLVDCGVGQPLAAHRHRLHPERGDGEASRVVQALAKAFEPPFVHEETDRAAVHPEHRAHSLTMEHLVQRLKQKSVASKRDDLLSLFQGNELVAFAEQCFGCLRRLGGRGEEGRRSVRVRRHPRFARAEEAGRQAALVPWRASVGMGVGGEECAE